MPGVAGDIQDALADAADPQAATGPAIAAYRSRNFWLSGGFVGRGDGVHDSPLFRQAQEDLAGLYFDVHFMGAAHVGSLRLAVVEADGPVVQRAGDGMAVNQARGQRSALVGTAIGHGEDM